MRGGRAGVVVGSWGGCPEPSPWGALAVGNGEGNGALRQLSSPAFPTGHQPVTVNFPSPVGQLPSCLPPPPPVAAGLWSMRRVERG